MEFLVHTGAAPAEARAIRQTVFVEEQGFDEEFDSLDAVSTHVVLFLSRQPVACCRFFALEQPGAYKLGRIAVLKPYRGQNLGRAIMQKAEAILKADGAKTLVIYAQAHAQGFYQKLGYAAVGELFLEEGVPHRRMEKQIIE